MINFILSLFGYKRIYYLPNGNKYNSRYDSIDLMMNRPIHKDMSVAPPWAKTKIIRNNENEENSMSNY